MRLPFERSRGSAIFSARLLTAVAVLVLVMLSAACSRDDEPRRERGGRGGGGQKTVGVVLVAAERASWGDVLPATGTAQANESVTLTANGTERATRVAFDDGDKVAAGQVLVELASSEENAGIAEAQAAVGEAERQVRRLEPLAERGIVARAELETQRGVRDAARARVASARARLGDRVIRAPFAGVLGLRRISTGVVLGPGDPIVTLDDVSSIKLDLAIPERDLGRVHAGEQVAATAAAFPGEHFGGQITAVDSRIEPASRTATVRVRIDNPDARLRPGMLLSVALVAAARDAVVVPEIAVQGRGETQYVMVAGPGGVARERSVEVGSRRAGMVEITQGLEPGERIVTDGLVKLRDGARIEEVDIHGQPVKAALRSAASGKPEMSD